MTGQRSNGTASARAAILALALGLSPEVAFAADLTREAVNSARPGARGARTDAPDPLIVKAQVLLDRAGFSPGVIDGYRGENFRQALGAFERNNGFGIDGELDDDVWRLLATHGQSPVLKDYEITAEDVAGPFTPTIPDDFTKLAELDRVAYTGPAELLAEKFHMDEDLLRALNGGAELGRQGARIIVADPGVEVKPDKVERIEVDKGERAVRVLGRGNALLAFYPASIGSEDLPAPSGTLEVLAVAEEPTYTYDPRKLDFGGDAIDKPLTIAPGPNNPVGVVWIDLSMDGYGIHGTPEPAKIGKTFSHGCIRMTNWDARELAGMVRAGLPVEFID